MWRSVVQHDVPRRGDRLRIDSFIGNGYLLWTEYEVLEAGDIDITLKPLASNGHIHPDDPACYKKIRYPSFYEKGMRIWIDAFSHLPC
jgi:hypothetical protein